MRVLQRVEKFKASDHLLDRIQVYKNSSQNLEINNEYLLNDNRAIAMGASAGTCLVCGNFVVFRVEHANLRETLKCPCCMSYNRQRQLVATMSIELFGKIMTLEEQFKRLKRGTKILLLEHVTNLAAMFSYLSAKYRHDIICTEYISEKLRSGDLSELGITHLDIHKSHFKDGTFDLIIHADVFEHVYDAVIAEKEQARILKKNGRIFYTAPFRADLKRDDIRAKIIKNELIYMKDPIYHGDPAPREDKKIPEGCLVFRIFSYKDLHTRYSKIGSNFSCFYLYSKAYGILGNNAYIFVVSK